MSVAVLDELSDDDFPSLDQLLDRPAPARKISTDKGRVDTSKSEISASPKSSYGSASPTKSTIRVRRLGRIHATLDNPFLRRLDETRTNEHLEINGGRMSVIPLSKQRTPHKNIVEKRQCVITTISRLSSSPVNGADTESDESESQFELSEYVTDSSSDLEEGIRVSGADRHAPRHPRRFRAPSGRVLEQKTSERRAHRTEPRAATKEPAPDGPANTSPTTKQAIIPNKGLRDNAGVVEPYRHLSKPDIRSGSPLPGPVENGPGTRPTTPPQLKTRKLVSPHKQLGIPRTPHRPSMDIFWSQDVVDGWNELHSPKKLILPPAKKSPVKSPEKRHGNDMKAKLAKKSFAAQKHALAQEFLEELDREVAGGKIGELSRTTGGVKLNWTNKLNTTAGRANWRRETVNDGQDNGVVGATRHRHHASIDLAEKVVDDESRLLNVIAHEFCHLANFMISGVTDNPHGKEFKLWANKCSRKFRHRGIEVTTKHSYNIDFKYLWECTGCGAEYKRHSKSIDPEKHRCGSCKSMLRQTRPVPRSRREPSAWQVFVREQMKAIKSENPGSPQKEVMRLIASKWVKEGPGKTAGGAVGGHPTEDDLVDDVVGTLDSLHLGTLPAPMDGAADA